LRAVDRLRIRHFNKGAAMQLKPGLKEKGNSPSAQRDSRLANPNKEFGEGNYKATRDYNSATERFVKSGKVDAAARAARPASAEQARELERAEEIGRSRSKDDKTAAARKGGKPTSS